MESMDSTTSLNSIHLMIYFTPNRASTVRSQYHHQRYLVFPDSSAASLATAGTIAGSGGIKGVLGGIPRHMAVMDTDDTSSKGTHSCDDDVPLAGQRTLPTREEVH